jgi:hypothetical protein
MKNKLFDNCVCCGCQVYTDGFGDDVIPTGYLEEDGWTCENCHSESDFND